MLPSTVRPSILGASVVVERPTGLGISRRQCAPEGLPAVVVHGVVPAVHDLEPSGPVFANRQRRTQAKVVIRDGPGKEQRAGVVPVGIRLDYFCASAADELTEIYFEALSLDWFEQALPLLRAANFDAVLLDINSFLP